MNYALQPSGQRHTFICSFAICQLTLKL